MLRGRLAFAQRFEYKYLITEPQARLVRGFVAPRLVVDPYADRTQGNQYPVFSLYLDSPDLSLYHSSRAGDRNRFKLRVRWYDGRPETPAFLEIKARRDDIIRKRRAAVRKDRLELIAGTFCLSRDDLQSPSVMGLCSLERFCELGTMLAARPKVAIRYLREAYVEPDEGPTRLTMDRGVACLRRGAPSVELDGPGWVDLPSRWVVLELKFTDTFPRWAQEMVQALDLVRTSASKYVRSVDALRRAGHGIA